MEKQNSIHEAKEAIQFLQQFIATAEGVPASGRKKAPSLGDYDFEIWNDQVIMATFKICSKTVARRRKDGTFKSFPVGRIHYYWRKDILPLRNEFLK
ncbi:MAG: hypothetical protein WBJ10_03450 [Daejeonella sp.]|uniref:hypothetical protein n=1 Tax=Daejeonella sp. TaxID=2805397 RepID=UPI003C715429